MRANIKWHENNTHIRQRTCRSPDDEKRTWPTLINPIRTPHMTLMRCLTSTDELIEEGQHQKHCVAVIPINAYMKTATLFQ